MENEIKSLLELKETIIEETKAVISSTISAQEKEEASRIATVFETSITLLVQQGLKDKIKIKDYLVDKINVIDASFYDTQSKEYIVDKFTNIAEIIGLDIAEPLTIWLYGRILGNMIVSKRPNEESAAVIKRNCSKCNIEFSFKIKSIDSSIPDFWHIVRCENCHSKNIISLRPGVKDMQFKNCLPVESYNKKDYTLEQIVELI